MSDRLGSAQWELQPDVSRRYPFTQGKFWLGRAEDGTAIGYRDDRHICVVSGNRGGKGTSLIVNNLCFWPGSAVIVDPKGENATVTADRRGQGSEYCDGMGQAVHVLDPFNASQVDNKYRSSFNPLDTLDPEKDETIDEAARLANAIVVVKDEAADPFWDESARAMLRGLILHVLTAPEFTPSERNLITIRNLVSRGEWRIQNAMQEQGGEVPPPHQLLWRAMECNPAFDGIVAGIGTRFFSMMTASSKTFEGVLQAVANHTDFLDSPGMRRVLARSDFKLSELKTRPEGMTLYLSLPQRYMDTHYRWLRMMAALTTSEMEITRGQPASGHPVLMVLDEFAGLKRMTAIENAVAQIAGFGVKLFFVLQSLEQLKYTYKDNWETFLANAGVKAFFSIEDHFTRDYVSKLAGETEIIRELRSSNQSEAESRSFAEGRSESTAVSQSATQGASYSINNSQTEGVSRSQNTSETFGTSQSMGWSYGSSGSTSYGPNGMNSSYGGSSSSSGSSGTSHSTTHGSSEGTSSSASQGASAGVSASRTTSTTATIGTSQTETHGKSRTAGTGQSESIHRRPLIQPDEVGRLFTRVDNKDDPAYPGLALVMVTGANPMALRRSHYYEDVQFIDCFSPHPDHRFHPAIPHIIEGIRTFFNVLEQSVGHTTSDGGLIKGKSQLSITNWLIEPGSIVKPGQPTALIEGVAPDNRNVHVLAPYYGKVSAIAAPHMLFSGDGETPEAALFTVKNYSTQTLVVDPFEELRRACSDALRMLTPKKVQLHPVKKSSPLWGMLSKLFIPIPVTIVMREIGALFDPGWHLINPFRPFADFVIVCLLILICEAFTVRKELILALKMRR